MLAPLVGSGWSPLHHSPDAARRKREVILTHQVHQHGCWSNRLLRSAGGLACLRLATLPRPSWHARRGSGRWPKSGMALLNRSSLSAQSGETTAIAASQALLFDCDGVIVETEDLHRVAYNAAFEEFETGVNWSDEYYVMLQNTVGGGKPKMRFHFNAVGWPSSKLGPAPVAEKEKEELIDAMQTRKTQIYEAKVAAGELEPRPGILALVDEALARPDLKTAICSAATKSAAQQVLLAALGQERLDRFDVVLLGDDVAEKKPSPVIYKVASERLGMDPSDCAVIEDSKIGLQAALGANMRCYITCTPSTQTQDFSGAEAVEESAMALRLDEIFPGLGS